jgi:pantothenate kinase
MTPELLPPALAAVESRVGAGRFLVGITGPPAAGKSTLATALAGELDVRCGPAVAVPMDGFHLSNVELERLGLSQRKGAPQTFDALGFVHLLRRLHAADEPLVYAPAYSRTLHESIGGVIPVPREVRVVVVEGNYLLHDEEPWHQVRPLLDLVLYVDAPDRTRQEALVRRQLAKGLDARSARAWVDSSDEVNARLIATTRDRADVILTRK